MKVKIFAIIYKIMIIHLLWQKRKMQKQIIHLINKFIKKNFLLNMLFKNLKFLEEFKLDMIH